MSVINQALRDRKQQDEARQALENEQLKQPFPMEGPVTYAQVAEFFNCHVLTVRRFVERKVLPPPKRITPKIVLFEASQIRAAWNRILSNSRDETKSPDPVHASLAK